MYAGSEYLANDNKKTTLSIQSFQSINCLLSWLSSMLYLAQSCKGYSLSNTIADDNRPTVNRVILANVRYSGVF